MADCVVVVFQLILLDNNVELNIDTLEFENKNRILMSCHNQFVFVKKSVV